MRVGLPRVALQAWVMELGREIDLHCTSLWRSKMAGTTAGSDVLANRCRFNGRLVFSNSKMVLFKSIVFLRSA